MAYVYILSEYEEHGATNVHATLNRNMLQHLLNVGWDGRWSNYPQDMQESFSRAMEQFRVALARLLEQNDADLAISGGNDLQCGWGGIQLHVVELE